MILFFSLVKARLTTDPSFASPSNYSDHLDGTHDLSLGNPNAFWQESEISATVGFFEHITSNCIYVLLATRAFKSLIFPSVSPAKKAVKNRLHYVCDQNVLRLQIEEV